MNRRCWKQPSHVTSGKFVAPMMITLSAGANPSISVSSCSPVPADVAAGSPVPPQMGRAARKSISTSCGAAAQH